MPLRVLRIQLDNHTAQTEDLPESVEQEYLGGRGAATWMLVYRLPPNTGPLARANLLIFSAGPLAGTGLAGTGGFTVSTRSPLTGAIAHSWCQGDWGAALRRAGYDMLVLEGQSAEWCSVLIDPDRVEVLPAEQLLGLDTIATTRAMHEQYGEDARTVALGPAGEAGVGYSSIVAEGRLIAEPAGTGAVMGGKHVKAICVRGGQERPVAEPARAQAVIAAINKRIATSEIASGIRQFGSNYYMPYAKEWGALTGRNGQDGRAANLQALTRTTLSQRGRRENFGCEGCPLPCHSHYVRRNGDPVAYPELEAVAGFGGRCGMTSPDALILATDQCLRLGLDVVSTSAAIAFLTECQEHGLSRAATLAWGDEDAILAALGRLGVRQEKRDMLSLGVGEMQEIFFGSATFAPQVKGLAMPALDPRALHEIALAMATAPTGGDYRYAMAYEEMLVEPPNWLPDEPSHPQAIKGKASRLIWHERFAAALDATGLCRRLALLAYQVTPAELAELLAATLGHAVSSPDLARLGERIITLERLFLLKHATVSSADRLPPRWTEEPLKDGRASGHLPALDDLLPEYYKRHNWDEEGAPSQKRLTELGISL